MRYDFLIETYDTERIKVISAWSMFTDIDLAVRPNASDRRGRSLREHMVHQCVSEDTWFRTMFDIDVGAPPLPSEESRLEFMLRYEEDSEKRLAVLRTKDEKWWEGDTTFFDVRRSRAWVMTRRMTHTSHHRGQQLALLRMLGRGHLHAEKLVDTYIIEIGGGNTHPLCRRGTEETQNERKKTDGPHAYLIGLNAQS